MKIRPTPQFSRDLKKILKKNYDKKKFEKVLKLITLGEKMILKRAYRDHSLKGNWKGYRECHIDADWLLIYRIENEGHVCELVLIRTGNHDQLF
jgi:addiction module toxin, RelE/StbE family